MGAFCAHFYLGDFMKRTSRYIAHGALIAAMYATLCYAQNMLLPESTGMAVQLRVAEALCVLAFFTPAAIPGLAVGCAVFNLTFAAALPLDALVGSLATLLATGSMWLCRRVTVKGLPVLGLCMPALWNALLVGWELAFYIGGGFLLNASLVAAGELLALFTLGWLLYGTLRRRGLHTRLFD